MAGKVSTADGTTSFVLDEDLMDTLKSTRGRKAEPSKYAEDVKVAAETGDIRAIKLSETLKAPYVMGQLRKAVAQAGWDSKSITVYDRSGTVKPEFPHGFVAFKVTLTSDETE